MKLMGFLTSLEGPLPVASRPSGRMASGMDSRTRRWLVGGCRDRAAPGAQSRPIGAGTLMTMAIVLALTVIGDAVAEGLAIPVPGAAIGMMMLASLFVLRGGADPASGRIFDAAAPHFPLFFVPAAAGVVASADLLSRAWLPIAVAVVLGTAVTLLATGALAQLLLRRLAKVRPI